MSGASATKYPPQVQLRGREHVPEQVAPEAAVRACRNEENAAKGESGGNPKAIPELLDADDARNQRSEDRERAEEERNSRRRGEVEREHEAELVRQQQDHGAGDKGQISALDAKRALPGQDDAEEDQGGDAVAGRGVRERREAVVEDVLGGAEIERPEPDRHEEHESATEPLRTADTTYYASRDVRADQRRRRRARRPATPHFAYQLRARVLELVEELPDRTRSAAMRRRRPSSSIAGPRLLEGRGGPA